MGNKVIRAAVISLGCDKNLTDSERLVYYLTEGGIEVTGDKNEADVIIVNTCGFIEAASDESEEVLRMCAGLKDNGRLKTVMAAGCLAARHAKRGESYLKEKLPYADCFLPFNEYANIGSIIHNLFDIDFAAGHKAGAGGRVVSTGVYAYIKIAEGCDNRCSYCAIPYIRGKYMSAGFEALAMEAESLAACGVKELIVVAQDTSIYGVDLYGENRLPGLLSAFTEISGIEAVRLMYCYPEHITDALIEEMARNPKICKYIDMPIQHASDGILRAMGRRSGKEGLINTINALRGAMPDITIRTTLMAGFPGETEADFRELLSFCKEMEFDRVGAFMYSREECTPAYSFEGQIPENVKKRRFEKLMEETARISRRRRSRFMGAAIGARIEGAEGGAYIARGEHDAPDVDGVIYIDSRKRYNNGELVTVKITGVTKYDLRGVITGE